MGCGFEVASALDPGLHRVALLASEVRGAAMQQAGGALVPCVSRWLLTLEAFSGLSQCHWGLTGCQLDQCWGHWGNRLGVGGGQWGQWESVGLLGVSGVSGGVRRGGGVSGGVSGVERRGAPGVRVLCSQGFCLGLAGGLPLLSPPPPTRT